MEAVDTNNPPGPPGASLWARRINSGLCPHCGEPFGANGQDETNIRRVDGADPWLLNRWGAYQELIAPCGHRVKCRIETVA